MKNIHFETISEYTRAMGKESPEHPHFAIITIEPTLSLTENDCPDTDYFITSNFYAISFKHVLSGEVIYGKKTYDCTNGTMLFLAPHQKFRTQGIKLASQGKMLLIHADYLANTPLAEKIEACSYFDYAVNEALHLSASEEKIVADLIQCIEAEYQAAYDEFGKDIILSYVSTLLSYGQRFYRRQFIQRKDTTSTLMIAFREQLDAHYAIPNQEELPSLNAIAGKLGFSQRYLSDAIKAETDISAKEHLQLYLMDMAKTLLTTTDTPVNAIGYSLGYDYPQYFVRIFKKKTGMTPTEFRQAYH